MYPHASFSSRIVKTGGVHPTSHPPRDSFSRGSYRNWDADCMQQAISAVEHGLSIRHAAEKFSVPRGSLHGKMN